MYEIDGSQEKNSHKKQIALIQGGRVTQFRWLNFVTCYCCPRLGVRNKQEAMRFTHNVKPQAVETKWFEDKMELRQNAIATKWKWDQMKLIQSYEPAVDLSQHDETILLRIFNVFVPLTSGFTCSLGSLFRYSSIPQEFTSSWDKWNVMFINKILIIKLKI